MKILIITMLFSMASHLSLASDILISCAPEGGQQSEGQSLYITYSLTNNAPLPDSEFLGGSDVASSKEEKLGETFAFRKELLGRADESALEKTTYKLGFIYVERETGFDLGYEARNDIMLISAEFLKKPSSEKTMAKAIILLQFSDTVKPLLGLMEPPDEIVSWQCLVNLKHLRKLGVKAEAAKLQITRLKQRLEVL